MGRTQGLANALKRKRETRKKGPQYANLRGILPSFAQSPQRELKAGFTGVLLRDGTRGGGIYPEYFAALAQPRAEEAKAVKGRPSAVINRFSSTLLASSRKVFPAPPACTRFDAPSLAMHRLPPFQRRRHCAAAQRLPALPPRKTRPRCVPRRGKICPNRQSVCAEGLPVGVR